MEDNHPDHDPKLAIVREHAESSTRVEQAKTHDVSKIKDKNEVTKEQLEERVKEIAEQTKSTVVDAYCLFRARMDSTTSIGALWRLLMHRSDTSSSVSSSSDKTKTPKTSTKPTTTDQDTAQEDYTK